MFHVVYTLRDSQDFSSFVPSTSLLSQSLGIGDYDLVVSVPHVDCGTQQMERQDVIFFLNKNVHGGQLDVDSGLLGDFKDPHVENIFWQNPSEVDSEGCFQVWVLEGAQSNGEQWTLRAFDASGNLVTEKKGGSGVKGFCSVISDTDWVINFCCKQGVCWEA